MDNIASLPVGEANMKFLMERNLPEEFKRINVVLVLNSSGRFEVKKVNQVAPGDSFDRSRIQQEAEKILKAIRSQGSNSKLAVKNFQYVQSWDMYLDSLHRITDQLAKIHLEKAFDVVKRIKNKELRSQSMVDVLLNTLPLQEEKALKLLTKFVNEDQEIDFHSMLRNLIEGIEFEVIQERFQKAKKMVRLTIQFVKREEESFNRGEAYGQVIDSLTSTASDYIKVNNLTKAQIVIQYAIQIRTQIPIEDEQGFFIGISRTLKKIATVYVQNKNIEEAEKISQQMTEIEKIEKSPFVKVVIVLDLAAVYARIGDHGKAVKTIKQAVETGKTIKDKNKKNGYLFSADKVFGEVTKGFVESRLLEKVREIIQLADHFGDKFKGSKNFLFSAILGPLQKLPKQYKEVDVQQIKEVVQLIVMIGSKMESEKKYQAVRARCQVAVSLIEKAKSHIKEKKDDSTKKAEIMIQLAVDAWDPTDIKTPVLIPTVETLEQIMKVHAIAGRIEEVKRVIQLAIELIGHIGKKDKSIEKEMFGEMAIFFANIAKNQIENSDKAKAVYQLAIELAGRIEDESYKKHIIGEIQKIRGAVNQTSSKKRQPKKRRLVHS